MPGNLSVIQEITELTEAPYNPRREMTDAERDGLQASLRAFGDLSGIVYNRRTAHLVCGHQRVSRLREGGAQIIKGAIQAPNGERFPIRIVDWTEAKEKRANVVANNQNIASDFDSSLAELLSEIKAGIDVIEFAELQLDALLSSLDNASSGPPDGSPELDGDPGMNGDIGYGVVAELADEKQQAQLLGELEGRGIKCRLLML